MTVDTAVRARLLAQAALTQLVVQRIYTVIFPQAPVFPAVLVQLVDEGEPMHLRGPVGMCRSRVQVDSVAGSKALADAVDAAVDGDGLGPSATGVKGWKGTLVSPIGSPPQPFVIHAVLPAGKRDGYDADELKQFRIMRDYLIDWSLG